MASNGKSGHPPFLLYGMLLFCLGIATYLFGVILVIPRYLFDLRAVLDPVSAWLVWYSGVPIMLGLTLALFDLLVLFDGRRSDIPLRFEPVRRRRVTVALTAYNDEESIAGAVEDFLSHPLCERVIVVSLSLIHI